MANRPVRIFQIAKELNISHTEILAFLNDQKVEVASHMSPVDENTHQIILTEFAKDKETVDRYRKEQTRKEIHDTRFREQQDVSQKFKLLSLSEQRKIEKEEKIAQEKSIKEAEEQKKLEAIAEKKREAAAKKSEKIQDLEKSKEISKEVEKSSVKKQKLRKIDLSEIDSSFGQISRKTKEKSGTKKDVKVQQSTKDRVKRTLAKIDTRVKKKSYKKEKFDIESEKVSVDGVNIVQIGEYSSVDEISKIFNVSSSDIIKTCFSLGIMATINTRLEWDVIALIAEEYEMQAEKVSELGDELYSFEDSSEDIKQAEARAPVVTIMGHVDHGKTSLLDYIREENVVAGEAGGITQHIGAHKVELPDSKSITFLDTPGHEAFTAMRARGAQITDIVVLVVAGDDSVMPQTIEAIDHAKAANVPIVVAINKMDKPGIDLDQVKRELSDHKVLVEEWGGKVQCVATSAKTGEGVPDLLNAILMEAELLELKANRNTLAKATVVDSKLDKGYGPVATILIQKGTLKVGDPFICNDYSGKVRSILNERGQRLKQAFPSDAIQVLGFDQVPQVADIFSVVENERELKRISTDRQRLRRSINQKKVATRSLDAMSAMIKEGAITQLALIIKGDVDGSIEALSDSLIKLNTNKVAININSKAVGMVIESDVLLADASKAVIIGFNVQISSNAKLQAKQAGVEIRNYKIIYNAVEDIKLALEGLLKPEEKEKLLGRALVQTQFKIPKIGFIAGAKVEEGIMRRNSMARLIRDNEILFDNVEISSLKRFKDDAKEIKEGLECGIGLSGVSKYKENDIIIAFEIQQIKRKLADS